MRHENGSESRMVTDSYSPREQRIFGEAFLLVSGVTFLCAAVLYAMQWFVGDVMFWRALGMFLFIVHGPALFCHFAREMYQARQREEDTDDD